METPTYSSMSARVSRKWDLFLCSASCDGYLPWEAVGKGFLGLQPLGQAVCWLAEECFRQEELPVLPVPSVPLRAREGVYSDD